MNRRMHNTDATAPTTTSSASGTPRQLTAQIEVNTSRMAVRGLFIIRKVYDQCGSGVRILIRLCIHEYYVSRDNVVSFH